MESRQKPRSSRQRQRIKALFKRTSQSPRASSATPPTTATGPPTTEPQTARPPSPVPAASSRSQATEARTTAEVYGDKERTRERYKEASELLQDAVKRHQKWGAFDFPELTGEPEGFNDSQFKDKINAVLRSRKQAMEGLPGWRKCEHAVQCAFTAFSPFAKNFLTIAKEAQQVLYGWSQY